jgi:uroporphyrinogen III methyltransferase/synthase
MPKADDETVGMVYLVGAGPGDPGLITKRSLDLLHSCDVVVYDNLVPGELIISLPRSTEKHYVGKKAGVHTLPQDEINKLMVNLARKGKRVVRLKGSDPMIFGRGGEEASFLKASGVPFEIVPGVTAGIGAAAYSGIPCTDREKASFVMFVTGHKAAGKESTSVPWEWVAKAEHGTIVIYMGVGEVENIVSKLLEDGMPPEIPCAVIERGTLPTQRTFTSPLRGMPDVVKTENIKPPAIFIIGDVVELREDARWFEGKHLFGLRIMVTRPADQAQDMYRSLRELGAEVLPYPTIATEETADEKAWASFKELTGKSRWLIFTSENGVRYFFNQFIGRFADVRRLGDFKIAAVGYGTARALKAFNIRPDFIPKKATTLALATELKEAFDLADANVVRIRGNLGDDRAERVLGEAGADVLPLQVYRTFHPQWPDGFKERLFEYTPGVITFTSGSTCEGLCTMLTEDEIKSLTEGKVIVSIGPSTSETIRSHGLEVTLEADEYSTHGVIEKIVEYYRK